MIFNYFTYLLSNNKFNLSCENKKKVDVGKNILTKSSLCPLVNPILIFLRFKKKEKNTLKQ